MAKRANRTVHTVQAVAIGSIARRSFRVTTRSSGAGRPPRVSRGSAAADPTHDTVIEISVRSSKRAAQRLITAIVAGDRRFSIVNRDGSVSIAASLTIDRAASTEELNLPDGAVVVDWERGTVARNGRRTELSRTELRLLGCLLQHRGILLSRDRLTQMVWPAESSRSGGQERHNALVVYICYLRRKLRAVGLGARLRTVRNAGYTLAV